MTNWDQYRYLLEVHRNGSLKAAAEKLGVNQTTVGRNLNALEEALAVKLVERRSDGFVLTRAGLRILESLKQAEERMSEVDRILAGSDHRVEGVIKLAMPGAMANHWLIPSLLPLNKQHPGLRLEFLTGPHVVNLARREADLAIRFVRPTQRGLVVRKAGSVELGLFLHPKLAQERGLPKTGGDLKRLPFVGLFEDATSEAEQALLHSLPITDSALFRSAAWSSVHAALSAGIGYGVLPTFMISPTSPLRRILPKIGTRIPVFAVYHPDMKNSARLRVVLEHFVRLLEANEQTPA